MPHGPRPLRSVGVPDHDIPGTHDPCLRGTLLYPKRLTYLLNTRPRTPPPLHKVYVCMTTMSLSGVYLFLVVPECAPRWRKPDPHFNHPPAAPPVAAPRPPSPATALSTGWRVVASSSWYTRVAIIWGVVSIMSNGTMNVLAQYLQMQLGFTPRDQAHVTVVSASVSLTTKCTILGILITYLGDQVRTRG